MKVGPGFCPVFLRSATSRTRCWLLPKGSKIPPPQGQTANSPKSPQRWLFWRYGALCSTYRRKRHTGATPPSRAANTLCRDGGIDWVEVVEAKRISLVRQRLFGFPWWNRRGKKVEESPTFAPPFPTLLFQKTSSAATTFEVFSHSAHSFQHTSSTITWARSFRSQIIRGEVSPRSSFLVFLLPSRRLNPSSANALVNDRTEIEKFSP